jgi:hypothetical protein
VLLAEERIESRSDVETFFVSLFVIKIAIFAIPDEVWFIAEALMRRRGLKQFLCNENQSKKNENGRSRPDNRTASSFFRETHAARLEHHLLR